MSINCNQFTMIWTISMIQPASLWGANGSSPRAELAPYKALSLTKVPAFGFSGNQICSTNLTHGYDDMYIHTSTVSISNLDVFYHIFLYPYRYSFWCSTWEKHKAKGIDLVDNFCLESSSRVAGQSFWVRLSHPESQIHNLPTSGTWLLD